MFIVCIVIARLTWLSANGPRGWLLYLCRLRLCRFWLSTCTRTFDICLTRSQPRELIRAASIISCCHSQSKPCS